MSKTLDTRNIFIAYSQADKPYLEELKKQLVVLERVGLVDKIWYDGLIELGADWEESVRQALLEADIILLLISADFIASDHCYERDMQQALELDKQGKARAIAVILRECVWESTPFRGLRVLPEGGRPIVSKDWASPEQPYVQVVEAIEKLILAQQESGEHADEGAAYAERIAEAGRQFAQGQWAKAKSLYQEALALHREGFQPSLAELNRHVEDCHDAIFYERNLQWGERSLAQGQYVEAKNYFASALRHRPGDATAQGRLRHVEQLLAGPVAPPPTQGPSSPSGEAGGRTKRFQLKIFGIEVLKLVMAFSLIGVIALAGTWLWRGNDARNPADKGMVLAEAQISSEGHVYFMVETEENIFKKLETPFVEAKALQHNIAPVKTEEGKWGYVAITPKPAVEELTPFHYDGAWPFSEAEKLAYVRKDGQCGFVDTKGQEAIALQYREAASFSEGLAMVRKQDNSFAFINPKGAEVISGLDSVASSFSNGAARVFRKGQEMLIDREGRCLNCERRAPGEAEGKQNELFDAHLKEAEALFEQGRSQRSLELLARARLKFQEALAISPDADARQQVSARLAELGQIIERLYAEDSAAAIKEGEYYYSLGDWAKALSAYAKAERLASISSRSTLDQIAKAKTQQALEQRRWANYPHPVQAFLHPDSKLYGIKDAKLQVLAAPSFTTAADYANGHIRVKKDGKYGFVDAKGLLSIPALYDDAADFGTDGRATVVSGREKYQIDASGKCVANCPGTLSVDPSKLPRPQRPSEWRLPESVLTDKFGLVESPTWLRRKAESASEDMRVAVLGTACTAFGVSDVAEIYLRTCTLRNKALAPVAKLCPSLSAYQLGSIGSSADAKKALESYKAFLTKQLVDLMAANGIAPDVLDNSARSASLACDRIIHAAFGE